MFQKLEAVEKKFEELTQKISDPNVIANQNEWREFMKEHAELEPIIEKYREYKKVEKQYNEAKENKNCDRGRRRTVFYIRQALKNIRRERVQILFQGNAENLLRQGHYGAAAIGRLLFGL